MAQQNVKFNLFGLSVNLGSLAVVPLVVGYALCSSLLAIINKVAITEFGYPSLLTALQYLTCIVSVYVLGKLKLLEHDPLTWENIKKFSPAALVFYLAIFTNTSLLKYANVDTFIVFRSSTPLLVAIADTVFRAQPWPSKPALASLFIILLGALGYVITDSEFSVRAYAWAFAYLATITLEMVYIKHVVSNMGFNTWGYVFYNNFISLLLSPIFWLVTSEYKELEGVDYSNWLKPSTLVPVLLSCAFGLAISFFGFACRKAISATSFTVVGVTNKLLTVAINVVIWSKHSSMFGQLCLLLTIAGGVLYQQSQVRAPQKVDVKEIPDEEVALKSVDGESLKEGADEKS